MQYAIIGAGGTGGVMGYFMTKAGKDVTLIARGRPVYPPRGKNGYDRDSDSEYLWNRCKTAKRTAGTSGNRRMHLCICQHQRTGCVIAAWKDSADRLWSSGKDRLETGTGTDPAGFYGQCY